MRIRDLFLPLAFAAALVLGACSGLLSEEKDEKQSILLQLPGAARAAGAADTARYDVTFRAAVGEFTVSGAPGGYITSGVLPVGLYTVSVTAYDIAGSAIGRGEQQNVAVTSGNVTYVTVTITPLPSIYDYTKVYSGEELVRLLASASEGDKFLLAADITLPQDARAERSVTIDGGGHTISGAGAYHLGSTGASLAVSHATFADCRSGEVIFTETVTDGTYSRSTECVGGGAIAKVGGTLTLSRCTFRNNAADFVRTQTPGGGESVKTSYGGAVALVNAQGTIADCAFENTGARPVQTSIQNVSIEGTAADFGGFVFVSNTTLSILRTPFSRGYAAMGGAIGTDEKSAVTMRDCAVTDCWAAEMEYVSLASETRRTGLFGGGVLCGCTFSCYGTKFSGNTAGMDYALNDVTANSAAGGSFTYDSASTVGHIAYLNFD